MEYLYHYCLYTPCVVMIPLSALQKEVHYLYIQDDHIDIFCDLACSSMIFIVNDILRILSLVPSNDHGCAIFTAVMFEWGGFVVMVFKLAPNISSDQSCKTSGGWYRRHESILECLVSADKVFSLDSWTWRICEAIVLSYYSNSGFWRFQCVINANDLIR